MLMTRGPDIVKLPGLFGNLGFRFWGAALFADEVQPEHAFKIRRSVKSPLSLWRTFKTVQGACAFFPQSFESDTIPRGLDSSLARNGPSAVIVDPHDSSPKVVRSGPR